MENHVSIQDAVYIKTGAHPPACGAIERRTLQNIILQNIKIEMIHHKEKTIETAKPKSGLNDTK